MRLVPLAAATLDVQGYAIQRFTTDQMILHAIQRLPISPSASIDQPRWLNAHLGAVSVLRPTPYEEVPTNPGDWKNESCGLENEPWVLEKQTLVTGKTNHVDWKNESCVLEKRTLDTGQTDPVDWKNEHWGLDKRILCTGKTNTVYWKNEYCVLEKRTLENGRTIPEYIRNAYCGLEKRETNPGDWKSPRCWENERLVIGKNQHWGLDKRILWTGKTNRVDWKKNESCDRKNERW